MNPLVEFLSITVDIIAPHVIPFLASFGILAGLGWYLLRPVEEKS